MTHFIIDTGIDWRNKKMANEIAVVNEQERSVIMSVLGGRMAQDIEFTQLDNSIEKIAAHTHDLSEMERESAAGHIKAFQERVVSTIINKNSVLRRFQEALEAEPNATYCRIESVIEDYEEQFSQLFESYELEVLAAKFKTVVDGVNAIKARNADEAPMEPFIDKEVMSPLEVAQETMKYDMECAKFENSIRKDKFHVRRDYFDFVKALNKEPKIKKFLKVLDNQRKAANQAMNIVKEKAEAAKMAILIGDADIRAALQEFHKFATTAI